MNGAVARRLIDLAEVVSLNQAQIHKAEGKLDEGTHQSSVFHQTIPFGLA